jgi:hypothetical protein
MNAFRKQVTKEAARLVDDNSLPDTLCGKIVTLVCGNAFKVRLLTAGEAQSLRRSGCWLNGYFTCCGRQVCVNEADRAYCL